MFEQYGLRQLGKNVPVIEPSQIVYLAVHTFFQGIGGLKPSYVLGIERLIGKCKQPIVAIECKHILGNGIFSPEKRYADTNPIGERYFLPCNTATDPEPEYGWQVAADIVNAFSPKQVYIVGSELVKFMIDRGGCVWATYQGLKGKVPNLTIDKSLCNVATEALSFDEAYDTLLADAARTKGLTISGELAERVKLMDKIQGPELRIQIALETLCA